MLCTEDENSTVLNIKYPGLTYFVDIIWKIIQ